jgi:flagellar basal-body rod protein FlgB
MATSPRVDNLLEQALAVTSLRSKAIANNIANMSTPGYRRLAVRFEELLAEAADGGRDIDLDGIAPELFQPMNTPVDARGNDVNLDVEVGELIKNGAMTKTYLRLLNKVYRQMELAIQGE